MAEEYSWRIVLSDGQVKEEAKGDKFDLSWEHAGTVKLIELVGPKKMVCNLETGVFNINGQEIKTIPSSIHSKKVYFRKRRQVRTDGHIILSAKTKYIFGFVVGKEEVVASIQLAILDCPEQIEYPVKSRANISFKQELIDLKGIGPKTVDQLLLMASSKEELAKIPRGRLIHALRDDVIPILDKYLGRTQY
jgi:hypothetical protein